MSRGKRYDKEPKLNMKKVLAVVVAIIVVIMIIFIIKGLFTNNKTNDKIISQSYFSSFKDNKWGVIDSNGNDVITPSYQEMIVIPNNKIGVFICTYDVNYDTGEYKTKVLNNKNEEIFTQFDKVEAISNKDENNNLWYEENVLLVQKDSKYGLINLSGKEIVPVEYDEIKTVLGIKNAFKVKKDNKYGIVDSDGKNVLEPQYTDIEALGEDNKAGYIVKDESGKYGIVDYSNNKVLDIKYDSIQKIYGNDMYVVTVSGKQKLIKKDGTDILTTGFTEIKQILSSQENAVIYTKSNKYGVMNTSGEILLEPSYDSLKETKAGIFIAKKDGKYGIINLSKEEKVPFQYEQITYNKIADIYVLEDSNFNSTVLNSNLETKLTGILVDLDTIKGYIKMRVNDEYKYYNLKFEEKKEIDIFPSRTMFLSKKDGKYGFVDKNGKVIVDYIYDDATEQNDYGYAGIKKDGKWGSIDSKGNVVQQPTYDLDEYLLVNFIGRWHLGLDLNMNYYNLK